MSNISDLNNMNLHEECLLKYLINPLELFYATELLKSNNSLIEKELFGNTEFAKGVNVNYNKVNI